MFTIILHDAAYTTERSWNGLRFAEKALERGIPVRVFLFSDVVYIARRGHRPPEGVQSLEDLLTRLLGKGASVSVCTTWVKARANQPLDHAAICFIHTTESSLSTGDLVAGAKMGTMAELVGWCRESQQVISF